MALSNRENYLRNASLAGHEWIPATVVISGASWAEQRDALERVCLDHPTIFPGFRAGSVDFDSFRSDDEEKVTVDDWGCTWRAELDGLVGLVLEHPLDDWDKRGAWQPPQPPALDEATRRRLADAHRRGELTRCQLEHGFFFMRLFYLRGYENFMMDVAAGEPRLDDLVEIVARYHERIVQAHLACGVPIDLLSAGDDLGTQTSSMLGPEHFRRWVQPTYRRLFAPARRAGGHVFLHHDGYVMDIIDEIIDSGVSIVNPQDLVNGIDALAEHVKGRVCICCDIDRQKVLPFGSPGDVRALIREEVVKLGSPAGGLEFIAGIYPPTPARNVEAMCAALEEFRTYWAGR